MDISHQYIPSVDPLCGLKWEFPVLSLPLPICVISKSQASLTILHKLVLIRPAYLLANTCSWRSTERRKRTGCRKRHIEMSHWSLLCNFCQSVYRSGWTCVFFSVSVFMYLSVFCVSATFSLAPKINLYNPYPGKTLEQSLYLTKHTSDTCGGELVYKLYIQKWNGNIH